MTALRHHLNRLLARSPWGREKLEAVTEPEPIVGQMMSCWYKEARDPMGLCHIAHPVEGGWELRAQYYHPVTVSKIPGVIGACKQVWTEGNGRFVANYATPAEAVLSIRTIEQALLVAPATATRSAWTYDKLAEGPAPTLFTVSRKLGLALPNPAA